MLDLHLIFEVQSISDKGSFCLQNHNGGGKAKYIHVHKIPPIIYETVALCGFGNLPRWVPRLPTVFDCEAALSVAKKWKAKT